MARNGFASLHPNPKRFHEITPALGFPLLIGKSFGYDLKRRDSDQDTRDCEKQIDQLVYALYGLTPEEIDEASNAIYAIKD
jgi:hypothetical protein